AAVVVHKIATCLGVVERDVCVPRDWASSMVTCSWWSLAQELKVSATVAYPAEIDTEGTVLVTELRSLVVKFVVRGVTNLIRIVYVPLLGSCRRSHDDGGYGGQRHQCEYHAQFAVTSHVLLLVLRKKR